MTRQHAEIPDHVEPRWGYGGAKPNRQVLWFDHQRARAVLAHVLQRELEAAIRAPLQALLGQRRPHHGATESLELVPVTAVNLLLGVPVDTERFGDRLARCRSVARALGLCSVPSNQTQQWLPRPLARDSDASSRRLVARKEARLLDSE